jgi:5-methylcytosine-specific restriction endonuclease McrA
MGSATEKESNDTMSNYQVLKLNSNYEPLEIVSWQDAISLWWNGRVEIVKEYEDFNILSFSVTLDDRRVFSGKCPAVIRLLEYVGFRRKPKYNRISIFKRDDFSCQFCGIKPGTSNLNLDHVVPRAQGGKTTWENVVTACIPCNSRKGNRTPYEAKMILKKEPSRPASSTMLKFTFNMPKTPEAWRDYIRDTLYWNQELENENSD